MAGCALIGGNKLKYLVLSENEYDLAGFRWRIINHDDIIDSSEI